MTDMKTVLLLLSQYAFHEIESSSEEDDSEYEEEEILTFIGTSEIERHPRQVGYLNIITLYSDADFFRHFRVTR
jgi:hypothetical protein